MNENKEIEIVRKIIADVFSDNILKISQLIDKGSVNRVFVIETTTAKFILRMNDADSLDEYEKENWCVKQAAEKNIPVARILRTGVFENKAYSIQEFIEGVEGRNLSDDKKFLWRKLGEYARRIHTIKVAGFGLKFRDFVAGNAEKSWLEYLEYNIESLNEADELLTLGVLTKAQSAKVRKIFENLRRRKFIFGLNHGDFSLKNTIVDRFGTAHLIDWGSAEASIIPHHDLIQLLKMNMLENNPDDAEMKVFLDGCGISGDEYEMLFDDLKSLLLLRAFDKLRWAIDWKIENLEDYIFDAKETVKRFLL